MTRAELHELVTPILDALEDHANGMKPLSREGAQTAADQLDALADQLMQEGVVG
jgi:hypothetical protein